MPQCLQQPLLSAGEEDLSPLLLKARLSAESRSKCNASYAAAIRAPASKVPNGILDVQLCAGSTSGMDACQVSLERLVIVT